MHEPIEILSLSRRSSLTFPTLFRTPFLSFFFRSLVSLFYFSFFPPSSSPPFTSAARGYWPLSNLIFSHSGDAEKHLRAIKDRRWEVQTIVTKKEREREIEKVCRKREVGLVCVWPQNWRARDGERYRRTIFEGRKMSWCDDRHRMPAARRRDVSRRQHLAIL